MLFFQMFSTYTLLACSAETVCDIQVLLVLYSSSDLLSETHQAQHTEHQQQQRCEQIYKGTSV